MATPPTGARPPRLAAALTTTAPAVSRSSLPRAPAPAYQQHTISLSIPTCTFRLSTAFSVPVARATRRGVRPPQPPR
ncbi:hypothetical protein PR003_g29667, partial [Phytophthora rubi]